MEFSTRGGRFSPPGKIFERKRKQKERAMLTEYYNNSIAVNGRKAASGPESPGTVDSTAFPVMLSPLSDGSGDSQETLALLEQSLKDSEKRINQRDSYLHETLVEGARVVSALEETIFEYEDLVDELRGQIDDLEAENTDLADELAVSSGVIVKKVSPPTPPLLNITNVERHRAQQDAECQTDLSLCQLPLEIAKSTPRVTVSDGSCQTIGTHDMTPRKPKRSTSKSLKEMNRKESESLLIDEAIEVAHRVLALSGKTLKKLNQHAEAPEKPVLQIWLGCACIIAHFANHDLLCTLAGVLLISTFVYKSQPTVEATATTATMN